MNHVTTGSDLEASVLRRVPRSDPFSGRVEVSSEGGIASTATLDSGSASYGWSYACTRSVHTRYMVLVIPHHEHTYIIVIFWTVYGQRSFKNRNQTVAMWERKKNSVNSPPS
jgi:hypothetical protein